MPEDLKKYRVFIASPGGLQRERRDFGTMINEYSELEAEPRGIMFTPVGWEKIPGGVGRPQSGINKELERSDYLLLVLWDRWGSSPSRNSKSGYSSGTEEEYHVARRCYEDKSKPMKDIIVCFKRLTAQQKELGGEQLGKVLEFKRKLEEEQYLRYHEFDGPKGFQTILRRQLAQWVTDHQDGRANKGTTTPSPRSSQPTGMAPSDDNVALFIKNAKFEILECLYALQQSHKKKHPLRSAEIITCRGERFYRYFYGCVMTARAMGLVQFTARDGVWTVTDILGSLDNGLQPAIRSRLGPKRAGPFGKLNYILGVTWSEVPP